MSLDSFMAEGQQALQAGDVAGALRAYEQAADLAPDDLTLSWIRGVLLVRLERYQDALPHLVRAQALTEQAASVWTHLGIAHTHLGNPAEALAAHQRAVEAAPGDPNVRIRLATALNDLGRPADALTVLDQTLPIATAPEVAAYLFLQRGLALNLLGRHEEALAALDLVEGIDDDATGRAARALQRAVAANALGRWADALAALDDAPTGVYPGPVGVQRATALNALGRHAEALAAATEAGIGHSGSPAARVEEGIALAGMGRDADALAALDPLVDQVQGPARARALVAVGQARARTGDGAGAADALARAATTSPPGPLRRAVLADLARTLTDLGRHEAAVTALDEARANGEPDPRLELDRAGALQRAGRGPEAAIALDAAVSLDPALVDAPDVRRRRLALAIDGDDPARLATALADAAAHEPERAALLAAARADALLAIGRDAEAMAALGATAEHDRAPAHVPDALGRALAALAEGQVPAARRALDAADVLGLDPSEPVVGLTAALVALAEGDLVVARAALGSTPVAVGPVVALHGLVEGFVAAADGDLPVAADRLDRVAALPDPGAATAARLAALVRCWVAVGWGDPAAATRIEAAPRPASAPERALHEVGRVVAGAADATAAASVDALGGLAGELATLPIEHPARALPWSAQAVLLSGLGRHDEALIGFERSLEPERAHPPAADVVALLGTGAAYAALEDPEPALRAFHRAHDVATTEAHRVQALLGQGAALSALGDGEKALEAHRSAIRLAPADARAWRGLALAYRRLGRPAGARGAAARSAELGLAVPEVEEDLAGRAAAPPDTGAIAASGAGRPAATGRDGGSWLGFWFASGAARLVVGTALLVLMAALAGLSLVDPDQVDGLGWANEAPLALAAPLLVLAALFLAPAVARAPSRPRAGASSLEPPPGPPPPQPPTPGPPDLLAPALAVAGSVAALAVATLGVRESTGTGSATG